MDEIVLLLFYIVDILIKIIDKEKILFENLIFGRRSLLIKSEIMIICILFYFLGYWNFKRYYKYIFKYMNKEFLSLVSYLRFVFLKKEVENDLYVLILFILKFFLGNYIIDLIFIKVCNNKRINFNKVFNGIVVIGKFIMGWFFGLKLYIVINDLGEIMNFIVIKGNVDDWFVVKNLVENLYGKLFVDKGYIFNDLFKLLWDVGLYFVYVIRKNMKLKLMIKYDSDKLKKRSFVEFVFNLFKNFY